MRATLLSWLLLFVACNRDTNLGVGELDDLGANTADLPTPPDRADAADEGNDGGPGDACRVIVTEFTPGASDLQIVVWIETQAGTFVDTAFVTRATGTFGIGNRPGNARLKSDFRWPFGRREMVLPVWAHRRNQRYPRVVMGGACGNSPMGRCPDGTLCAGDCNDDTIVYHPRISSYEPYFCSPSGASRLDAMSCASRGTFPKGAFADAPAFSLYPPRADIRNIDPKVDSVDLAAMAGLNDLVAISQATPVAGAPIVPVYWVAPSGEADDVVWVEVSRESDFNAAHRHPSVADATPEWDFVGHNFLGQPSVAYRVPIHVGARLAEASTNSYAGYGSWDGSDGTLHPPDATITVNAPGSGAGRLNQIGSGPSAWRVKVHVEACR